ncbi:hypothetical protein Cob_v009679 [Colletotrichum orbiculare MAFF 240422]|uniref:Uncharacterized protein n=1 Tax=Colletotrichum orbiculare (strain 104-T / ATCC 96160 / CBS 514.97 / LARS 414 / MAFF 240422) TaxID=1213857 RepID=A0A484FHR4_COLOR|nr:hypothetical protein Cob_v009679 [Colletotrichum orbiculare MAFF 240422]
MLLLHPKSGGALVETFKFEEEGRRGHDLGSMRSVRWGVMIHQPWARVFDQQHAKQLRSRSRRSQPSRRQ